MTIHGSVRWHAELRPSNLAVVDRGRQTTYRELARAAGRLAHRLRRAGVRAGDRVGVHIPRSTELIIAELAVLTCGGVYVPLDPDFPRDRLEVILRQAEIAVVVDGTGAGRDAIPFDGTVIASADQDRARTPGDEAPLRFESGDDRDPAFAVYTSGSTGEPKGVVLSHASLLRLLDGSWIPVAPSDVVAQTAHACFDLSLLETWLALTNGAASVVIPLEVLHSPDLLAATIRRECITVLALSTSLFHAIAGQDAAAFAGVRTVMIGGGVLSASLTRDVLAASRPRSLINAYGPTEGGVIATSYDCVDLPPEAETVPIGFPVPGTCVHVLDGSRLPIPAGVVGDLYVGGEGVAVGYLSREDLTSQRFVPDLEHPGTMMYDTGDRARYLGNGALEFHGRRDDQVKIRGFRVEPGEVQTVLCSHPAVTEAAVVAVDGAQGRRLAAYVVLTSPNAATRAQLQAHLRSRLPEHMVPGVLARVDRLPLTPRGKLDRASLSLTPPTKEW